MPELAEVEYYRKQWEPAMGVAIENVLLHSDKRVFRGVNTTKLKLELQGQQLVSSATHGKQMCFRFGESCWLGVHLGMTGKIFHREGISAPDKHEHLVINMKDSSQLVFSDPRMFGRILYSRTNQNPSWWSNLPYEVLSPEFTFEYLSDFLRRRSKSPIKSVLLMQETFPGVGNWMADEILWRARIDPRCLSGAVGTRKRRELYKRLQEVTRDALRVIGTDWGTPPNDWLFNHRWKAGGNCPKTGKRLHREQIGGRTTCWSPKWQTYRG